jgi:GR25 family glycosyltransferase involved in LPS biosynthesis
MKIRAGIIIVAIGAISVFTLFSSGLLPSKIIAFSHAPSMVCKYLKPIEISEAKSGLESIDCIYVLNLDERPEKWKRVNSILKKKKLHPNRVSAINGWKLSNESKKELAGQYPVRMGGGQIGCLLTHLSIIKDAYERGFETIWVMEDDIVILENVKQIPSLLKEMNELDPDWDLFYTDVDSKNRLGVPVLSLTSDFRPDMPHHSLKYYLKRVRLKQDIMRIYQRYGMYSVVVSKKGMKKILDYYSHLSLWSPIDVDIHYIPGIRQYSTTRDIVSIWTASPFSDTTYSVLFSHS